MSSEPSAHGARTGRGRSAPSGKSARVKAGPAYTPAGGASLAQLRDPSTGERYSCADPAVVVHSSTTPRRAQASHRVVSLIADKFLRWTPDSGKYWGVTLEPQTSVLAAISNAMVRLPKDQFGRGPTRARTEWAGPHQLVVTLEDTLTPVERRLRTMGEPERLRDTRLLFQYAAQAELTSVVEQLTGRRVRAFVSGLDTRTDVACEVFVLAPPNGT